MFATFSIKPDNVDFIMVVPPMSGLIYNALISVSFMPCQENEIELQIVLFSSLSYLGHFYMKIHVFSIADVTRNSCSSQVSTCVLFQ